MAKKSRGGRMTEAKRRVAKGPGGNPREPEPIASQNFAKLLHWLAEQPISAATATGAS
jgi:hypothetical protein